MKHHLKMIVEASLEPRQRLKLAGLFQPRIDSVSSALKPELLEARLPLPQKLRATAPSLIEVHGLAAAANLKSLREMPPDALTSILPEVRKHCVEAIRNLCAQQHIALFVASRTPRGLWAHVQEVVSLLPSLAMADRPLVEKPLKSMLAMAAVQPESFTARHLGFLADYLDNYGAAVEVAPQPTGPGESWYWLEEGRDLPPVAIARRPPPDQGVLLCYGCANLSRIAGQHLLQLEAGLSPDQALFPMADANAGREALTQAQKYWSKAPLRHSHRRPTHCRAKICAGLPDLWNLLRAQASADVAVRAPAITEWMVLNASPGGYALMHISGAVASLLPGEILGLRLGDDHPWNVGIIRWVRSDNPEHLELGLEMISPLAVPVQLVRTASKEVDLVPALLFPATPGLDHDETLMTARGVAEPGAYLLIRETDGRLQLTQCDVQDTTLQTTAVEVFEFRRNFAADG